jgi:DNA repair protein RecN (Recombination protein N)
MLKTLTIHNYALIEKLETEFEPGLNVLTGETGAGKSIIIGALSLVLGERADAESVRKGSEKAIVEAVLAVDGNNRLKKHLHANEIEFQPEIILRREVSAKGTSRAFINDTPCTLGVLKEAGDLLVDLHGQHEHQSLLRPETHIDLIDEYGRLQGLAAEFAQSYADVTSRIEELSSLRAREHQLAERKTLHEFQIGEIDAVNPREGEEDSLERELTILENAEKLFGATERLYQILYEGENAVHDQLLIARNELEKLGMIDAALNEAKDEAASATAIVDELAKVIQRYNSRIEFNPERLEEIRLRLGQLSLLKKKYGGSIESIIRHRETIGREFELANNFGGEIAAMEGKLREAQSAATAQALRLSAKRSEIAKKVKKGIEEALRSLGIADAQFEAVITHRRPDVPAKAILRQGKESYDATEKGMDQVEFFISTNAGEDPKPLAKVASGGEISRVMLSLKMILAKSDQLPLLIFDEIDSGVSGRIAQSVGQSMKKLSQFHQVIAITHLPQIAGLADNHFAVEKTEENGRSFTHLRKLTLKERVNEVARLMSGEEITQAGLKGARELMNIN